MSKDWMMPYQKNYMQSNYKISKRRYFNNMQTHLQLIRRSLPHYMDLMKTLMNAMTTDPDMKTSIKNIKNNEQVNI